MAFDAVGVFGLTFDFLLKICFSILCPIRNSNLSIVSAYPPSGRNMVTFMNLKNSKLVMVKFIWQLLFWHSYRRLLSQKRKSASWDISTLKERRISVLSKGRKKNAFVQNIKTYRISSYKTRGYYFLRGLQLRVLLKP